MWYECKATFKANPANMQNTAYKTSKEDQEELQESHSSETALTQTSANNITIVVVVIRKVKISCQLIAQFKVQVKMFTNAHCFGYQVG